MDTEKAAAANTKQPQQIHERKPPALSWLPAERSYIMELLQLKYFQELARSGHLSQTADALHIAQPSLSQTLKRLENELGTPLFDRIGKKIVLNKAGTIYLKYVDDVFAALDNASLELAALRKEQDKTVSLHVSSASMLLPELIRRIQKADPDIRLQIFQQSVKQAFESPSLYLSSDYICPEREGTIPLLKERLLLALPKHHPLTKKDQILRSDLTQEAFLSLHPSSNLASILQFYCQSVGFEPHISTCVDNPAMMRELLRLNLGIPFIPEHTWHDFASDTVTLRPVSDWPMERYLLLSWDAGRYQTPAAILCRQVILSYFTEKFAAVRPLPDTRQPSA